MESQPQNLEFRINPENFHPWIKSVILLSLPYMDGQYLHS